MASPPLPPCRSSFSSDHHSHQGHVTFPKRLSIDEYEMDPVEGTNLDAANSKAAAAEKGYMVDRYISKLVPHPKRALPFMNLGTFVRVCILDQCIENFLRLHGPANVQIVSLGAGWDTRWFGLIDKGIAPSAYYEIDFENVLEKKRRKLDSDIRDKSLTSSQFVMISENLRNFESEVVLKLVAKGFRLDLPTLILSEIVLVYLTANEGNRIIEWFAKNLQPDAKSGSPNRHCFLTLEHVEPCDPFGEMMLKNFYTRGILLKSITDYPTVESQKSRYLEHGWRQVSVFDMKEAYDTRITGEEKRRLNRIEMMDEVEEWQLLCSHYCFLVATK